MSVSRTAAVVVTWEGGAATVRCVESLLAQTRPPAEILVVDNASSDAERTALRARFGGEPRVRLLLLDENRQFAGGLNAGAASAGPDIDRLLFLNNDTLLEPDALARLEDTLDATPGAGIAGPRVMDVASRTVLTAGERHGLWLLCVPRTLLRYRRPPTAPYPVSGVMGCALLATRACWRATGGFSEEIAVYYEDVDFCLAAREHGFGAVLEPRAVFWHDGIRGFASGLTPWAAFLKARNPWLLMRRRGARAAWLGFLPTYGALLAASAVLWALRGRGDVVRALGRGVVAGVRAALGAPAAPVAAPRRVG
jgi:GT2 family glycosyltransferase